MGGGGGHTTLNVLRDTKMEKRVNLTYVLTPIKKPYLTLNRLITLLIEVVSIL